jgi:hypothetical protein
MFRSPTTDCLGHHFLRVYGGSPYSSETKTLLLAVIATAAASAAQDALDACNGWEVDRQVEQAMDALR